MNRLEFLCKYVDDRFAELEQVPSRSFVYAHIHAVTMLAVQIAKKRGVPVELAAAAARLHDIHTLETRESQEHGPKGAERAAVILQQLGGWTPEEIRAVCGAIACHSEKELPHEELTEVLIDADVLEHCLHRLPGAIIPKEEARWAALQKEFGL